MQGEQEPQDRQVIHVIHKGATQQIQVSLATFRGRTFGDLRLYVFKDDEWIPTQQKGCTVDVKQLEELEEAVARLRDASDPTMHLPF